MLILMKIIRSKKKSKNLAVDVFYRPYDISIAEFSTNFEEILQYNVL